VTFGTDERDDQMLEHYDIEGLEKQPHFNRSSIWASPLNYEDGLDQPLTRPVYIHDVTLRDGEQAPGVCFSLDERLDIAKALSELGVQRIEAGMPTVSPQIFESIARLVKMRLDADIVSFARAHPDDIDASLRCGVRSVVIEHTVNPYLCRYAYGLSDQQLLDRLVSSVSRAKQEGLHTTFMGWDFFRAPLDFTKHVYSTVVREAKPDAIVLVDTFGVATPITVYRVVSEFRSMFPGLKLEFHCHNEFGWATGAAISAIAAGADGVHSAINGLGERTGNLPTEEIVAAMKVLFGIECIAHPEKLASVCEMVARISQAPIAPNKPVMGTRVFNVESGVVVDVYNKMAHLGVKPAMTPYLPELFGAAPMKFVIGKGSGNATIKHFLEKAGLSLPEDKYELLLSMVKSRAYEKKGLVSEEEFLGFVDAVKNTL
jgi:isopropylmalate/homocitrate/citramalate synthase